MPEPATGAEPEEEAEPVEGLADETAAEPGAEPGAGTPNEEQSDAHVPPRPGEEPTITGTPARRTGRGRPLWVSFPTFDDPYDDRVRPMNEMP